MKIKLSRFLLSMCLLGLSPLAVRAQLTVNVKFARGRSAATYNGTIKGDRYVDYRIDAKEGQTMSVKLTRRSGEPPYFNVLKSGSEVAIADDAREVTEWTGQLPSSDTYVVRVYVAKAARLAGRTSNFRMTVSITGGSANNAVDSDTRQYNRIDLTLVFSIFSRNLKGRKFICHAGS